MRCYYANMMNLELYNKVTLPRVVKTVDPARLTPCPEPYVPESEKLVIIRYFNESEQNYNGENMEFELFLEVFSQLDQYTAKMMIFQVNCDKDQGRNQFVLSKFFF